MIETKIYIDFGTGYELFEADKKISLSIVNDGFIRKRKNLSGSLTFTGATFDLILAEFGNDVLELPIKVAENDVLQGEFFMSISADYDYNEKKVTLGKFTTNDIYNVIDKKIDFDFNLFDEHQTNRWFYNYFLSLTVQTYLTDAITTNINIQDWNDYITYYNVEGILMFPGDEDMRWIYFTFVETTDLGGGLYKHIFKTNTSDVPIDGYEPILFQNKTIYCNYILIPESVYRNLNIYYECLEYLIDKLVLEIGLPANVNYTDSIDFGKTILAPMARVLFADAETIISNSKISLRQILNMLKNTFQIEWYINESEELSFLHLSEILTTGNIDFTSESEQACKITYNAESLPKYEYLKFANQFDIVSKVEYERNTADIIEYLNDLFTVDILKTLENSATAQNTGFLLAKVDTNLTTEPDAVVSIVDLNANLQPAYLLETYFNFWRYANNYEINGVPATSERRPLFAHAPLQIRGYKPTDLDLNKNFVVTLGNFRAAQYEYDFDTKIGILQLIK